MGSALKREPAIREVLACLVTDADALKMTFLEWCHEYGYDLDDMCRVKKAERIYKMCVRNGEKLQNLLKEDYDLVADYVMENL